MQRQREGWSAFYKTSKGEGKITCDNGESAAVTIKVTGGGLTFGKSEMKDATGTFSPVNELAISGTGEGWNLGVSGSKFTIAKKYDDPPHI